MKFDFSVTRDHKTFKRLFPIAGILKSFLFKTTYVGAENIPDKGSYLVCSNHIHATDPGQVCLALKGKPVHFMGKSEFWENPIIGRILTKLNGFPVVRGKADMTSINYASKLIEEGHIVGIFPEGTRTKGGKLGRAKSGAALVARMTHADVLPVSLYYEGKLGFGTRVTVRVGELIPYEKLGLTDDGDSHELKNATSVIWDSVTALWEEGHCK